MKTETKEATELVVQKETSNGLVVPKAGDSLPTYDLTKPLPDLEDSQALPLDLMPNYWTPEKEGETKRLFFVKVALAEHMSKDENEVMTSKILPTAFFLEPIKVDGETVVNSIINASKKLVGLMIGQSIREGNAFEVRYMGKKKNKTNAKSSDQWSVKPLIVKV